MGMTDCTSAEVPSKASLTISPAEEDEVLYFTEDMK